MVVSNGLPKTLSEVFRQESVDGFPEVSQHSTNTATASSNSWRQSEFKAKSEWSGAIAALEQLLLSVSATDSQHHYQGLLLSGPAPVLSHNSLISQYHSGIFTADFTHSSPYQLPAARDCQDVVACSQAELPLLPHDPIATEQFCLVLTSRFSLLMVLGQDCLGLPAFQFSFEPSRIYQAWMALRWRLVLTHHPHLEHLDTLVERFKPIEPDYRLVTYFSQQLLKHLPSAPAGEVKKSRNVYSVTAEGGHPQAPPFQGGERMTDEGSSEVNIPLTQQYKRPARNVSPAEVELLQALTHEIRTPLTTIRTITRSLLKRAKLEPNVMKRLEAIDQECTEQINRMELIFRAAELATRPFKEDMGLAPISLEHLFEQSIPCWQKQAQRRNVKLDVVLPHKLPTVISDPGMLNQILTGLMEKFTRSLPNSGKIRVEVTTAGNQLKLQLQSPSNYSGDSLKSLGHLLMFQPETGNLSLNLDATKNLFHAMGGKLIVRQRPQQGETVTIFLPLVTPIAEPNTPAEDFY